MAERTHFSQGEISPAPAGLTAEQLIARVRRRVRRPFTVNAAEVSEWLLRAQLAEIDRGRQTPSRRCVELAELLSDG